MPITYFASSSNPADNGSLGASSDMALTPPGSMVAGDLAFITIAARTTGATFTITNAAGQGWTALTSYASAANQIQSFWCRFNGTWSNATVNIDTSATGTVTLTGTMNVFRPSAGANGWIVDGTQGNGSVGAPSTPFTMTATGATPTNASTVAIASFTSDDDNTYGTLSGTGWVLVTYGGANQVRNSSGTDHARGNAYKIQTSAAATGNVTLNQTALGGDAYAWARVIFAEVTLVGVAAPTQGDQTITATIAPQPWVVGSCECAYRAARPIATRHRRLAARYRPSLRRRDYGRTCRRATRRPDRSITVASMFTTRRPAPLPMFSCRSTPIRPRRNRRWPSASAQRPRGRPKRQRPTKRRRRPA